MELLLSACYTFDKKITLPGKQESAVYTTTVETDPDTYQSGNNHSGYAVYNIDTDISDIMIVNSTNTSSDGQNTSSFLPRD